MACEGLFANALLRPAQYISQISESLILVVGLIFCMRGIAFPTCACAIAECVWTIDKLVATALCFRTANFR